jgi:hypothetical protein
MQRSSESIACLAAALAKAQAELTNPEKMALARPSARSAMPRCPAGLRSCARP